MTPAEFAKVAERHYSKILYTNVQSAVDLFFRDRDTTIFDVCCGPGLMAEKLLRSGYNVYLVDNNPAFLNAAKRKLTTFSGRGLNGSFIGAEQIDILIHPAHIASDHDDHNALFINASGYFLPKELIRILGFTIDAERIIANFLVDEDQKFVQTKQFVRKRGLAYTYNLGPELPNFTLNAISERDLNKVIKNSGYRIVASFTYTDVKTERLLCLQRL